MTALFETTDSCQLIFSLASAGRGVEASKRRQLCCRQVLACLGLSPDILTAMGGRCRQHSCW